MNENVSTTLHSPPAPELSSERLPRGRFLYQESEEPPLFALYERPADPDRRLWITAKGLWERSRAAGPFERHEAMRALNVANLKVPYGCELVGWEDGIRLFETRPLPGEDMGGLGWERVWPADLETSVSAYGPEDVTGVPGGCCAPPTYPPTIRWDHLRKPNPALLAFILDPILRRHPHLASARIGTLGKAWNAHAAGSLIWAGPRELDGDFYIADLVPPDELMVGASRRRKRAR